MYKRQIKNVHAFKLADIAQPEILELLRNVFYNPEALKPGISPEKLTEQAAERFGQLADGMRVRGVPAPVAAHFLMKLIFCMFAEDIALLPDKLFAKLVKKAKKEPARLKKLLGELFDAMSTGGDFGVDSIHHFNGGLFADADVIELSTKEIEHLIEVADTDWGNVEPSIFGTLFERTLDPAKRSQIGAHYTGRADIETLLEPVVMTPLRREWVAVRERCDQLWAEFQASGERAKPLKLKGTKKASGKRKTHEDELREFQSRLAHVTILDPACGSGNFLYVAIHLLLELEKEVIAYAHEHGVTMLPAVRPTQLKGIEINEYAQQLAQVVIWIGYLQWKYQNGHEIATKPVLEPIESIARMDAILDLSDPEHPREPEWPEAEFIVGNPPFLGGNKLRGELGDEYVDKLFKMYVENIPNRSDLCCYWFEKARSAIERNRTKRAGLLATQGIRGGLNRSVLKRIKHTGGIFFAESDRQWILDGATVHISMIAFDDATEIHRQLNGTVVESINSDLSFDTDITSAQPIRGNTGVSFQGPVKVGAFDVEDALGQQLLASLGVNSRPSSDVVRPWMNGIAITSRMPPKWIIDFAERSIDEACEFESPFEFIRKHVKPERDKAQRERRRRLWWIHGEVNNAFRNAIARLRRYLATCQTAKHRMFVWIDSIVLPGQTIIAFAREDDALLGYLHSRIHLVWAHTQGTQLREKESGDRYTPTTCFETFPFPEPTKSQEKEIAAAAAELDRLRCNWLNPPEWTRTEVLEFPGSVDGPWARYVQKPDARGIGQVKYPRVVPKDEDSARQLARRTLTNLYNERPTWLALAHRRLDEAVFAAYGWDPALSDEQLLERLLALNLERAAEGADQ